MQLGKPHAVGFLDDQGVGIGDIDARLNDGGADQDVDLPFHHFLPNLRKGLLVHLAMGDADAAIGESLGKICRL